MKKILVIISMFLLFGCSSKKVGEINYDEIMKNREHVIIDVRTSEEYLEGHVVDAINIPYDEINEDINISKDKVIFVYCKSGGRSKIAYSTLLNLGYEVYDLGAYDKLDLSKE